MYKSIPDLLTQMCKNKTGEIDPLLLAYQIQSQDN